MEYVLKFEIDKLNKFEDLVKIKREIWGQRYLPSNFNFENIENFYLPQIGFENNKN